MHMVTMQAPFRSICSDLSRRIYGSDFKKKIESLNDFRVRYGFLEILLRGGWFNIDPAFYCLSSRDRVKYFSRFIFSCIINDNLP